jgi:hypothetical protein
MRAVHDRFAEREMTTAEFIAVAEELSGEPLDGFIRQWLEREGLPELSPKVELRQGRHGWKLRIDAEQLGDPYHVLTHVEVITDGGRSLRLVEFDGAEPVEIELDQRPTRVVFNALDDVPVPRESFYVWRNFIDDFHLTLIVYGTASQIEANHTLARRWQQLVADTYVEILPPLVKDAEIDAEQARTHDLMALGTLDDNYLFHNLSKHDIEIGRGHFRFRGRSYTDPDDGLFVVLPNPYNPEKVLYAIAANSAAELYAMTSRYHREIPSWAVFEGDEIVDQGYFEPEGFIIDLPSGGGGSP